MGGCDHPGCTGAVDETGYCDTCLEPPVGTGGTPDPGAASVPAGATDDARRAGSAEVPSTGQALSPLDGATSWWGEGLVDLPDIAKPDMRDAIITDPHIPEEQRFCHRCRAEIGRSHHGQPGLQEGTCYKCGTPYSYIPRLKPGEMLNGRYEIVGCVGHGGVGWVFLARDSNLEGQPVVVKGLIDTADASRAETVINERKFLIQLDHPNIVSILDFVEHAPQGVSGRGFHGYIVMEYVVGRTLQQVAETNSASAGMPVEHAIAYCLQVLKALAYMHGRGLGFGDLSPGNVMVAERGVKLIDLGAVTTLGSQARLYTEEFAVVSELQDTGVTVRSDLYALGCVLRQLFRSSADFTLGGDHTRPPVGPIGPGIVSLRRFIRRCTAGEPRRRFASAGEAASQLSGVLHEIVALREGRANAAPALLFSPAPRLLDDGLGSVPKVERWLTRDAQRAAARGTCLPLDDGVPGPQVAAADLPVPRVDPADPGAAFVAQLSDDAPAVVLDRLADFKTVSAEAGFARCRAYLRLAREAAGSDASGNLQRRTLVDRALGCLHGAVRGQARDTWHDPYDWRLAWHLGIVALAEERLEDARRQFDHVYDALPGETAPKLALALCAEHLGDFNTAERRYDTVWRTDRAEVSAAFGLARVNMGAGRRGAAIAVLNEVAQQSRHYDAAQLAVIRVNAGLLALTRFTLAGQADSATAAPGEKEVAEAARLLGGLHIAGNEPSRELVALLWAEVWQAALDLLRRTGPSSLPDEKTLGTAPTEKSLRKALEKSFREFARWAPDSKRHTVLVDLANTVRPRTLL